MSPSTPDDPKTPRPARDPDMIGADAAILRAAKRARLRAAANGTPIAIWEEGKIVWVNVNEEGELERG